MFFLFFFYPSSESESVHKIHQTLRPVFNYVNKSLFIVNVAFYQFSVCLLETWPLVSLSVHQRSVPAGQCHSDGG